MKPIIFTFLVTLIYSVAAPYTHAQSEKNWTETLVSKLTYDAKVRLDLFLASKELDPEIKDSISTEIASSLVYLTELRKLDDYTNKHTYTYIDNVTQHIALAIQLGYLPHLNEVDRLDVGLIRPGENDLLVVSLKEIVKLLLKT